MRLYLTSGEKSNKLIQVWSGTMSEAKRVRRQMKLDGMTLVDTDETEVPTNKTGLLEFLNKYILTDKA